MHNTKLPTVLELTKAEQKAKRRLKELFKKHRLQGLEKNYRIGMGRLTEKGRFSRMVARYMAKRDIRSLNVLADRLFIEEDYIEAISWLRYPCAFRSNKSAQRYDGYLLSLCELVWDPNTRTYHPVT